MVSIQQMTQGHVPTSQFAPCDGTRTTADKMLITADHCSPPFLSPIPTRRGKKGRNI